MNCKDFETTIHEIVSQRMADKTKQLEALEHASHCLWCALRLHEETKLTESLQAFAATLHVQRAPARVEEALVQAFRERTSRESAPRSWLAGRRLWRGLSWGVAFAATIAIAWIVIFQWPHLRLHSNAPVAQVANQKRLAPSDAFKVKQEQPMEPGQSDRQVRAQSKGVNSLVVAQQSDKAGGGSSTNGGLQASALDHHPQQAARQVAFQGRPGRDARDESTSEVTTDFFSLGTCDESQCMDEATLVRVTLPAEALLAFGLGMDNDFTTGSVVQADVALGGDGVPFAIRFVD